MIKKTVHGKVYFYERTPYYDRTLKNTKYHYKYVGKKVNGNRLRKEKDSGRGQVPVE
jgi:hypothetical protein